MVPPPKPFASCRGTGLLATAKGPLSRVPDNSAAVMTLSEMHFDVVVEASLVDRVTVDSSLIVSFSIGTICSVVTAATFIEKISVPVAVINLK